MEAQVQFGSGIEAVIRQQQLVEKGSASVPSLAGEEWTLQTEHHWWVEGWDVNWQWQLYFSFLLPWLSSNVLFHIESKSLGKRKVRRRREKEKADHRWEITAFSHRNCYCKSAGHDAREILLKVKVANRNRFFATLIWKEKMGLEDSDRDKVNPWTFWDVLAFPKIIK